jgi:isoleucyl-tRNA synthetase
MIKTSRNYTDNFDNTKKLSGNITFNFLDGPPFVNGKPHHGHLLVSYIKDSFARYYSSLGYKLNY